MERDFKGIWIPKEVWLSNELSLQEKVLLVEINSLDGTEGCYASNDYFSEFFGYSKRRIIDILNSLEKKGYIKKEIFYKGNSVIVDKRIIRCTNKQYLKPSAEKFTRSGEENCTQMSEENCTRTGEENCTYNNTLFNNTINKKIYSPPTEDNAPNNINIHPYEKIIDYLNSKANTKYKPSTQKTQKLIRSLINQEFTLDDFKKVIDIKTSEWLGTSMEKYLRPETLFGTKFESYLNQKCEVKNDASEGYKFPGVRTMPGHNMDSYTDEELNDVPF